MEYQRELQKQLDEISHHLALVRKLLIYQRAWAKANEEAWQDLLRASEEISLKWRGDGAVEEIRKQRSK